MKTNLSRLLAISVALCGSIPLHAETVPGSSVIKSPAQEIWTARPNWAFQLDGTAETFAGSTLSNSKALTGIPSTELRIGYQPAFLQAIGVLTLGTHLSLFPFASSQNSLLRTPSSWATGGEVRYQARFFRKQWLVPTVSVGAQYLAYQLTDGTSGRAIIRTPSAGFLILLNAIDPGTAVDFFEGYGAKRTYVLAELRRYEGNDSKISLSGNSLFFGLRFEY